MLGAHPDELKSYRDDADAAVCTFGPIIYAEWRATRDLATVDAADAAVADLVARYGDGRRLLYVHRLPDTPGFHRAAPAVRTAMVEHFKRHDAHFLASVVAIESTGIGGAMARAVGGGVMLLLRSRVKTQWFSDARDGVRWLATYASDVSPFDAEAMIASLQDAGLCRRAPG